MAKSQNIVQIEKMEALPFLNITGGILLYAAKFLMLIASSIAVYKNKNLGSILLLLGIISVMVGDVLSTVLLIHAGGSGPDRVVNMTGVNAIINAGTHLFFAVGLLVYILRSAKHTANAV